MVVFRIYPYSIATLNDKLNFIRSQLDIPPERVVEMVTIDGSMLHKSLPNLARKIRLVEEELQKDRKEILSHPKYLGYSLKARILPRIQFLQTHQVDASEHSLHRIFASTDATFSISIAMKEKDSFAAFKEAFLEKAKDLPEDETFDEAMLEQTFVQEQNLSPVEEVREAERRFAKTFRYQVILE